MAPVFREAAVAPDRVIEAIESAEFPFIVGVQWHPDAMVAHHRHARKLFEALVVQVSDPELSRR